MSKAVEPPLRHNRHSAVEEADPPDPPEMQATDAPTQLAATTSNLASTRGVEPGNHLRAPLAVGNPGEAGIALLAKRFSLAFSVGDFTGYALNFPKGSLLFKAYVSVNTPFNGTTPTLSFGTTASGAEIAGPVDISVSTRVVEIAITVPIPSSSVVYVSASLGGSTAGECAVCLNYCGAPLKVWQ